MACHRWPNLGETGERSRPAEAHGTEAAKKRAREGADKEEPVDDNQFGKTPKQAKVKKALIVSGGLCGFKARRKAIPARQFRIVPALAQTTLQERSRYRLNRMLRARAPCQNAYCTGAELGEHGACSAQVAGDLPLRSYSYSEEQDEN